MPQEPGLTGTAISLGGIEGKLNRGRESLPHSVEASTTVQTILPANVKRVWALIQNIDAAQVVYIDQGRDPSATSAMYRLYAGGSAWLINQDNPWTGDVRALADGGTPQLLVTEVSIQ